MIRLLAILFLLLSSNAWAGSVELKSNGYFLDGRPVLLRGGSLQWFRIPQAEWEDRILKFKAAGFNTIDMYVSWRDFEAVEGSFDFKTKDFRAFLDLAIKHGLYVYFRPGPYITNEMDGGGVPAWVFAKSSKRNYSERDADGTLNLRTNDKDYLDAVERYWARLLPLLKPYLYTEGGPIILFSVENEYSWFKTFFEADKAATLNNAAERPRDQQLKASEHLLALRDIALKYGINVPITTCQGEAAAVRQDLTPGVAPVPNYYGKDAKFPEKTALDQLQFMHSTAEYANFPSGTTETERNVATLRRQITGGLDIVMHFNIVGMFGEDRQNSVTLVAPNLAGSIWDAAKSLFSFSSGQRDTAYLQPKIGLFHNVVDYYGAIAPGGTLREKFYGFRRSNLFLSSFEERIAAAGRSKRSSPAEITGNDRRIFVHHPLVGSLDPDASGERVNYWMDLGQGSSLLGLLNQTGQSLTLPRGSIEAFGSYLPRFSDMTIPVESYPGKAENAGVETDYSFFMPLNIPLHNGLRLDYSSSEVLYNKGDLLVLYGNPGTSGELRISGSSLHADQKGFSKVVERRQLDITLLYRHEETPQEWNLFAANGKTLRVLVLDRYLAGRAWFLPDQIILGPDFVNAESFYLSPGDKKIWTNRSGSFRSYDFYIDSPQVFSAKNDFMMQEWKPELDRNFPGFRPSSDTAMEKNGIYEGHAWYRSTVTLDHNDLKSELPLYIDSVSDIAALYINGRYITTVTPLGTEINSASKNPRYGFPIPQNVWKIGKNSIILRTEIWGHGSFMFPRGTVDSLNLPLIGRFKIPGLRGRIPALGFDAMKGLMGLARVGGKNLDQWEISAGLDAERVSSETGSPAVFPIKLDKGSVRIFTSTISPDQWPDSGTWSVPMGLQLRGRNAKATIYLNDRIIGRWLSDDHWLLNGNWVEPIRTMWSAADPDTFPISFLGLQRTGNKLKIIVEDASPLGGDAAVLHSIQLKPLTEEKRADESWTSIPYRIFPLRP